MAKAYLLIQSEPEMDQDVAEATRQLRGVMSATEFTGPYDVIALAEAGSLGQVSPGSDQKDPGHRWSCADPLVTACLRDALNALTAVEAELSRGDQAALLRFPSFSRQRTEIVGEQREGMSG